MMYSPVIGVKTRTSLIRVSDSEDRSDGSAHHRREEAKSH